MKKILFIDYYCEFGHNNINKIYLNWLIYKGYEVHVAMKYSYYNELSLKEKLVFIDLPEKNFKKSSKIKNRINQIKILKNLKNKIKYSDYSFCFFSYFDEISFYFSGFRCKSILMVHGNTEGLDSRIKKYFLKKIASSTNITFLVFLENFKKKFNENGIFNVIVSSHGLPEPYNLKNITTNLNKFVGDRKIVSSKSKIIFVPNISKFGDYSINNILNNNEFKIFLEIHDLILYVKGSFLNVNNPRIFLLPPILEFNYYITLLTRSDIVLLNYPDSFKYRVSGIFFECIANNKPLIVSRIDSFTQYLDVFNYNPYYSDFDEMLSKILLITSKKNDFIPYRNLDSIIPFIDENI